MSTGTSIERLQEIVGSAFWSLDNGWRERDGERIEGVTCRIVDCRGEVEVTVQTVDGAIEQAIAQLYEPKDRR